MTHDHLCVSQGFPRSVTSREISRATRIQKNIQGKHFQSSQNQKIPSNLGEYRRFQNTKSPRTLRQVFLWRQATSPRKMETSGRGNRWGQPTYPPESADHPPSRSRFSISFRPRLPQTIYSYRRPRDDTSNSLSRRQRCREEGQQLDES